MDKIELTKEYLPLSENFKLEGMKKLNIIVGKNNVGKTRFFEAVERDYKKTADIVFIRSNDVNPSENHYKTTASSSDLIKNVSILFKNLKIEPKLKEEVKITKNLKILLDKVNKNFQTFTSSKDLSISSEISKEIKIETIVQSLMNEFEVNEKGVEKPLKLENIGQGYQRLLIASILKAYVDILGKMGRKDESGKEVLILFEEPELFLHPKLKRVLNSTLKNISEIPNYTVMISTHDPYFLWSNLDDNDIKVYSFIKENALTVVKEDIASFEIEDEMLHINLFNKLIEKMKNKKMNIGLGIEMEKTSKDMEKFLEKSHIIKKKYLWKGKTYNVLLPVYVRNVMHHRLPNEYSGSELEKSVKILSKILSNIL